MSSYTRQGSTAIIVRPFLHYTNPEYFTDLRPLQAKTTVSSYPITFGIRTRLSPRVSLQPSMKSIPLQSVLLNFLGPLRILVRRRALRPAHSQALPLRQ